MHQQEAEEARWVRHAVKHSTAVPKEEAGLPMCTVSFRKQLSKQAQSGLYVHMCLHTDKVWS